MTNPAWAALITRIPAANDLPLNMLLELIETSASDLNTRTGNEIATAMSPRDRARFQAAAELAHAQPRLRDAAGHNAVHAWANTHLTTATRIYRRHAKDVMAEINDNPFAYLHNHPARDTGHPTAKPANGEATARRQPPRGQKTRPTGGKGVGGETLTQALGNQCPQTPAPKHDTPARRGTI